MTTPNRLAKRLTKSASNIWVEFRDLSRKLGEVNLGQGQPDYAPQRYIQETLSQVVLEGNKYLQYTREQGHPRLVEAIADLHSPLLGRIIDPMNEVIVTHGAYESLLISCLSLVNPGDEVILIEPFFFCYDPMIKMCDGVPVYVPLRPSVSPPTKSSDWRLDPVELESKFSDRTKLIVINAPNNPLGKTYSKEEMEMIAALCIKYDVICVTDEVYEWIVYPGSQHVRMATLPGMWDRTITISSAGKTFGVTGWRVGWSIGPKDLIDCLMIAHQNGDNTCNTPAQEAIARCIEVEIPRLGQSNCHFTTQMETLLAKRDLIVQLLKDTGFTPCVPEAGFFILADWSAVVADQEIEDGSDDSPDLKFAKWLVKTHGIVGIPPSALYGGQNNDIGSKYVRFCFVKTDEILKKAQSKFAAIHR